MKKKNQNLSKMILKSENKKKTQKITFYKNNFFLKKTIFAEKKCDILGGRNLTGALQSSLLQNPGGGTLSVTEDGG